MKPKRQPEARKHARRREAPRLFAAERPARMPLDGAVTLVGSCFWIWSKMPPSAKCFVCAFAQPPKASSTVNELDLRQKRVRSSFGGEFGMRRAIEVLGDDRLRRRRVEEVEIGLAPACACPWRRRLPSTTATGGSARIESDGATISNLSAPNSLQREEGLVLPGDQHVADAALGEGGGRAARAGVEHRHVLVERLDERPWSWPRRRRTSVRP